MDCPALPPFNLSSWDSIDAAFCEAPSLEFGQHWKCERDANFAKGIVRLGWLGSCICFDAHLDDSDIFTAATKRNQELYRLGDTLELFAGVRGHKNYIEYHYAPNGTIMQLFWPQAIGEINVKELGGISQFMVNENHSQHAVKWTDRGWRVCGMVPASALGMGDEHLLDQEWDVSFGRYDYDALGNAPVLSCTSPHKEGSFHRRHEWTSATFLPIPHGHELQPIQDFTL
jgi:hypothetical protein